MACQHKFQPGDIVRWAPGQEECRDRLGNIPMVVIKRYCSIFKQPYECSEPAIFVKPFGGSTWNDIGGTQERNWWELRFVPDPFLMAVRKRRHPECQPSPEK